MVLIIDGEIVADNDPRAIAMRNRKQGSTSAPSPAARVQQTSSPSGPRAPGPAIDAANAAGNPLDAIAGFLGIQGQSFTIPGVWRIAPREVPLVAVVILALLTLFFGWQVLAVAVVLHVVSGLPQTAAPAAGAGPTQGPRPPPAR